ncbi:MAG: F0F1 ATP synthase subunit B [Lachnospiraceae bacterium]|nr:F0F1 ATP synthase subunit B [Lachnospiraceae bacterium]
MEGFENFIGFNPWTAALTLFNLILVFIVLRKFLFKPVRRMIDERQKEIDDLYADAEGKQAEADKLRLQYEERIGTAKAEAAQIIRNANLEARKEGDAIVRIAKSEASAIREKAEKDIALEKKRAMNEMKDDISAIAVEIAEKVMEREITVEDQSQLVDEFIRKIGEEA